MTTRTGEPPPPAAPPDINNQVGVHNLNVHESTVPENAPLTTPLWTKQPVYTVEDSHSDFPTAPNHRFMIQLHLIPHLKNCKTFNQMKWIDCVKHLIGIVNTKDETFHILKKHGRPAVRNAITNQAQVPTTLAEFEQDFGFDISMPKSAEYVKLKLMVASKYTFKQLFAGGYQNKVFKQYRKFGWWVNDMRVSTQGNLAQIGWLKQAHPVYTCQENLLANVRKVFHDVTPHFDVICKWENKSYCTATGDVKKMRVRVLSLLCPRDIARDVNDIVFDRWLRFNDPNSYWHSAAASLRDYMYIPYRKTVQIPAAIQLSHLLEHGQWMEKNNDVVYLDRIATLDNPFTITQYLTEQLQFNNPQSMIGKQITLRALLNAWTKVDQTGNALPKITAIE